nr:hypothetical protein [Pseudomonas atagonensis]
MPRERTYLRYQLYRSEARQQAAIVILQLQHQLECHGPTAIDLSKVRFEPIDQQALQASTLWKDQHFWWSEVVEWKGREPLSLDIAIWFEEELCGLCFANPNASKNRIRIVRLEGRPFEPHPLKKRIGALAMIVIERYAQLIGSKVLEIQEPSRGAISHYQELGFDFDAGGRLVKTLENLVS